MPQDNSNNDSQIDNKPLDTADDILDILNEDDGKTDNSSDKNGKENLSGSDKTGKDGDEGTDEGKDDKENEEEVELDEEEEEVIDEVLTVPVSKKEILKVYPDLFKKFPALEAAYYKSQQYTEIFPTVDDAREAVEHSNILAAVNNDLSDGKLDNIFQTVKNNNPKAFNRMADNLIQSLSRVDEGVGLHVISNIIRHTLVNAKNRATRTKNQDLATAAQIISEYMLEEDEIQLPTKLSKSNNNDEDDERLTKINRERQQLDQEKYDNAFNTLDTRVNNTIKATIDTNIDKNNVMPAYVKRAAVRDVQDQVNEILKKDPTYKKAMDSLWKRAKEANYSKESLEPIRSARLSKVKPILQRIIPIVRTEALKGIRRGDKSNEEKDRRGPIPPHRSSSTSSTNRGKDANEIPKNMSTRDYIMSD